MESSKNQQSNQISNNEQPKGESPDSMMIDTEEVKESIPDMDCPICYTIMVEPVKLPCKHHFCHVCLREFFSKGKMECPLCRAVPPKDFQLRVDEEF